MNRLQLAAMLVALAGCDNVREALLVPADAAGSADGASDRGGPAMADAGWQDADASHSAGLPDADAAGAPGIDGSLPDGGPPPGRDATAPAADTAAPPGPDAAALPDVAPPRPDVAPPLPDVAPPPPDAGPIGASACYGALAGALLCEGFEAAVLPGWWTLMSDGSVGRVTQPVFLGLGALEGRSDDYGGNGFAGHSLPVAVTSGTVYLRAQIRVPAGVALEGVTALFIGENGAPNGSVSVLLTDNGLLVVLQPRGRGADEVLIGGSASTPFRIARDRWQCLQLETLIGRTTGAVRLTVDGQVVAERAGLETSFAGGMGSAGAGVVFTAANQPAIRIGVDDLAVDTKPLPCN